MKWGRLRQDLRDARMERRVARLQEPDMFAWFSTEIMGVTQAFRELEKHRALPALSELRRHVHAQAALLDGLEKRLGNG